jgi:hypothetical protein
MKYPLVEACGRAPAALRMKCLQSILRRGPAAVPASSDAAAVRSSKQQRLAAADVMLQQAKT